MRIYSYNYCGLNKYQSLHEVFKINLNKKNIISFVGGGGKTSLIYSLAKELSDMNKKVIVTTTTKMLIPKENVVLSNRLEDVIFALNKSNIVSVGTSISDIKMSSPSDEIKENIVKLVDFILVEADGSKRLPLKIPANHEPVIFEKSNLVVGVSGLDAIGKSINEICHRKELVLNFLGVDYEHIINEEDVARVLCSSKGQRKNVKCRYCAVINKVDGDEDLNKAIKVSKEMLELGLDKGIITSLR